MYIYTGTVYTRRGPPQVDVQCAQNERSDLSSSSRWKLRKTSSRRKLHAVPCRCTRMSCTAVLTASSLGGPCIGSQACNCCQGRSPPFPASQAASAAAPMYSQRYRSASGATASSSFDSCAHPGALYANSDILSSLYTAYTTHHEVGIALLPIFYSPRTSGPPLEILEVGLVIEDKGNLHRWSIHLHCVDFKPVRVTGGALIGSNSD